MSKLFKLLFNTDGEGGTGGGGSEAGTDGSQDGDGGSQPGTEETVTLTKAEFDKLQTERDNFSADLRKRSKEIKDLQAKVNSFEEGNLKEQGKLQELLDKKEAEYNDLKAKYDEDDTYKGKWESYETKRRESLLAELPDDYKAIGEKLDLESLEDYVKLHSKTAAASSDNGYPSGSENKLTDAEKKDFYELFPLFKGTETQMAELYRTAKPKKEKKEDK